MVMSSIMPPMELIKVIAFVRSRPKTVAGIVVLLIAGLIKACA